MRYFFHLGYLGTNYSGWQKHPDGPGVQQVLENALSQIFKTPLWIVGCGRTDAQVHASQYFFHLDTTQAWDFDLLFRLNKLLPSDIAVFEIIPMPDDAHARFDAIERSYDYFIHTYKDPFLSNFSSYYLIKNWDIEQMNRAAGLLLKYNDYHAFCKMPDRNTHTICHISEAGVFTDQTGDKLRFRISANRFLGKMVRIITGKLIEIGTGTLSVDEFESHLIDPLLLQIIKPAYPQGLYLSKIKYPYLDIAPCSTFSQMLAGETNWKAIK
ncbi:tRNA pseudouridine(38-40) synthase TruA [Mucilaginibacter polytrichastri]|uniref:tRNA pseudouridine synthase A n=1 Tax=Mucilaginibacter polytrichastri TaxID=1302689 RepID=A0A1Q6A5C7_9SPHI|nr:tRNA pseudouridine(38-40) synthase TruA [Mucilaginibacter polytrichastri]OKS89215.1 tRNA pseudouridine synthase A [Mucilaginibacter polytrichastri]SFS98116.1 tRNA pseudouridine38-40 synthase [Mucilaginibacter polytrichastri]